VKQQIETDKKANRSQIDQRKQKKEQMHQQMSIIENYVQTQ
jgi:hypothetical protein